MTGQNKPAGCVVVDAGPFIKNYDLAALSDKLMTVRSVNDEIVDKRTRGKLATALYDVAVKEPRPESIGCVTSFSRKTGDYFTLSAPDLAVLALAVELAKEAGMEIRTELSPESQAWKNDQVDKVENYVGFYNPNQPSSCTPSKRGSRATSVSLDDITEIMEDIDVNEIDGLDDVIEDDDEDGEDGWITAGNIKSMRAKLQEITSTALDTAVPVACCTTDFAMQNVLMQMGVPVISGEGRRVKEARRYGLRCFACMRIVPQTGKKFCPNCGHKTLERVLVKVDENGDKIYERLRREPTTRGTIFRLPTPKSGQHAVNPVLMDYQPVPQQKAAKKSGAVDVFSPDFAAFSSPFTFHDTTSRSARKGHSSAGVGPKPYWEYRNPNQSRKSK